MNIQMRSIAIVLNNRVFHYTLAQGTTLLEAGCELDVV